MDDKKILSNPPEPSTEEVSRRGGLYLQPEERKQTDPLIPAYYGKLQNTMATMSTREAEETPSGKLAMVKDDVLLLIQKQIDNIPVQWGINVHKLLSWGIGYFIMNNPQLRKGSNTHINYDVKIPFTGFCQARGYDVTPHDDTPAEKKRVQAVLRQQRKRTSEDLKNLRNVTATWTEGMKKGGKALSRAGEEGATDKDFINYSIIGSHGINKDFIEMTFDPKFVKDYLLMLPQTKYHKALTKVKSRTAYVIGLKMLNHYFKPSNLKRHVNNRMKNKTTAAGTDLPTIDEIEGVKDPATGKRTGGKHPGHWRSRIKEPYERALDELYRVGFLFGWEYRGTGGRQLTDSEATEGGADAWAEMNLFFEIIGNVTVIEG